MLYPNYMALHTTKLTVSQDSLDLLYDALLVGMARDDAYLFAGLTEAEITAISEDDDLQRQISQLDKRYEYSLLQKLDTIIEKQTNMGKENAITWALEKMYPRYSNKPQTTMPDLHIHLDDIDPAKLDTVSIHKGDIE